MAYNPTLYSPYGQPNPWQQSIPTMQQAMQPVNGLVSVTGLEGAKAYQLPPNSSMPLFDQDNDVLYLKTTDSAGYPTVKAFRFEPMDSPIDVKPVEDFVPREEFDALAAKVEELSKPKTTRRKTDGE